MTPVPYTPPPLCHIPAPAYSPLQIYFADRYTREQEDALDVAVLDELPCELRDKVRTARVCVSQCVYYGNWEGHVC